MNENELGKVPPQATDIEEAVLGALMLDKDAFDEVSNILSQDCFYVEKHQKIFNAILTLQNNNSPIDMLTVTQQLKKNGEIDQIGGVYAISGLTNKVASAAHIVIHAQILKEKLIGRQLIQFGNEVLKMGYSDDKNAIDDVLPVASKMLDTIYDSIQTSEEIKSWQMIISDVLKNAEKRCQLFKENKCIGRPTPLKSLTKWTNGWTAPNVYVIAARPSQGKTSFVLSCIKEDALNGGFPALFSLETSSGMLGGKIIVGEADIDAERFQTGNLYSTDWKALDDAVTRLQNLNIYIDDSYNTTINQIKVKCRRLKKKGQLTLIVIDYLQLAEEESKSNNREAEVAKMSRKVKNMAKELNVPVLLLSQLNRSCEMRADKRPNLSDLRESGAIEQDADMVMFIHRPEKYGIEEFENKESTKGVGELIVAKFKEGKTGTLPFRYNPSLTRIYDYNSEDSIPVVDSFSEAQRSFENETPF